MSFRNKQLEIRERGQVAVCPEDREAQVGHQEEDLGPVRGTALTGPNGPTAAGGGPAGPTGLGGLWETSKAVSCPGCNRPQYVFFTH